jgi:hypothetical protein
MMVVVVGSLAVSVLHCPKLQELGKKYHEPCQRWRTLLLDWTRPPESLETVTQGCGFDTDQSI